MDKSAMKKPNDYSTYFDENGEPLANLYTNSDGSIKDGKFAEFYSFAQRQDEIYTSLLPDKERKERETMREHIQDKMNS